MAQVLTLKHGDRELAFQLSKTDRTALYGFIDTEILDEQQRPCQLATLADDGRTLVGSGGMAGGYLTPNGEWRDKKELKPVDSDGNEIIPVPSTFKATVLLDHQTDVDDYLAHNIRSVYLLECQDGGDVEALKKELNEGVIYSFPFSYRGSLEADTAFLLTGADNNLFLTIGKRTDICFIGFEQTADLETVEAEIEEDEMDFSMM